MQGVCSLLKRTQCTLFMCKLLVNNKERVHKYLPKKKLNWWSLWDDLG